MEKLFIVGGVAKFQIVVIYDSGQVELRRRPGGKAAAPIPLGTDLPALSSLKAVTVAADGQSLFIAAELSQNGRAVIRCLPFNSKIAGRDIELPQIFATSLAALPAGGVAFAGSDGSWGVWEVPGTLRRHGVSRMWSAPPDALRVDQTGDEIEVRLGPRGAERLRFSVSALELRPATTGSKLRPPAVEAKAPHSITGWQHNPPVLWNGAAILGRQYDPAALAISPAKDAFVIGSNQTLSGFRFERSETDGCPRPPAPKDHVPAPCFALFVPSPVRSLNYSGDGRYALALLSDGTVHWYDARDGSEKLALVLRPSDARWLLFRPDGLFAASPGGAELGGYQVNDTTEERAPDFFPLSRVKKRFERPEEIAATLSGAAEKSGPLSANWPPSSLLRSELPPLLTILEPADGAMVSSPLVTVKIAMRSLSDRPTTALRARIDGRPISIAQPRGIVDMAVKADTPRPAPVHNPPTRPGSTPSDGTVSINLTIPERDCVVALFAESDVGAGPPALLRLRFRSAAGQTPAPQQGALTNAAPQPRGSLRVLAIGVDDYKQAELRLRYPGKDARDLAALIEKLHGKNGAGLYQSVDMRVLTGREATKAAILESLDWLQHRATSADTTLLFLAGHGINDAATGDYFFLPVDADLASAMRTMLPASTLRQVLANVQGRIVLMLDTCHSGNILGRAGRKLRGLPPLSRAIAELSSVDSGIVVMAAATGDQASIEDTAWQNGAFAKAILEGLGGRADLRHTGRVTVNMLDLYVSERVRELTDGSQTPATAKPSTIADFPIVLSQP